MLNIQPAELSNTEFKKFGYILSQQTGEPSTENEDLEFWSNLSEFSISGKVSAGVMFGKERHPIITTLERHEATPEVLVALKGDSVICVGRSSGDEIDKIEAFYLEQGDAVCLSERTWHWAPIPVGNSKSKFLVLFSSGTPSNDLYTKELKEKIKIKVA